MTTRIHWTKKKRDLLAQLWSDPEVTRDMIQKEFSGASWDALKKKASRLGYNWNSPGIPDVDLPFSSLENPIDIQCRCETNPKIMMVNSPFIGIEQEYGEYDCLFSNALRYAKANKCDAVVVSGNLFFIDIVRFSKLKPFRARVSGIHPDQDMIDYPESVREYLGDLNERMARGDLSYLPFKVKLDHVISMITRAVTCDDEPLYDGPIYTCFGNTEESLAAWLTNEDIHARLIQEKSVVSRILSHLKKAVKSAPDEQKHDIMDKIDDWETYQRVFLKMTNVADSDIHHIYNQMRKYIIQRVEDAASNIKFIGTGKAYIRVGKGKSQKTIKIVHRPSESDADTEMGKIMMKVRKSINRGAKQPDHVLIGGTNLTYTQQPISWMSKTGPAAVMVAQLPTAVDARELNDRVDKGIKQGNILFKLTQNADFTSGTIVFEWVDGIPRKTICPNHFLTNSKIFATEGELDKLVKGKNLIYGEAEGDEHCGHKHVAFYEKRKFPHIWFHSQIVHKFLKNAPICFYMNVGDIVQGHNHDYEQETHPEWMPDYMVIDAMKAKQRELKKANLSEVDRLKEELYFSQKLLMKNTLFHGILLSHHQLESYISTRLRPHLEHFRNIILRAKKANLDTRFKLGTITYLSGNHFQNTHLGEFIESKIVAQQLRDELLIKYPDMDRDTLEEVIRAPMLGNIAVAEGVIGINPKSSKTDDDEVLQQKEHYYYAISAKHKQGDGSSKFADSMRPMRESVGKRGTTAPFFEGRFILYLSGHTHYGGITTTRNSMFLRTGSQTFHDPYGEQCNFPLNNISTEIIGLPKDGPESGPIVNIHLSYEEFVKYAKKAWRVNKKKLFANSIV